MKFNGNQSDNNETESQKNLIAVQKEYITLLEKIMIFISHEIRQKVAHIQGISYLLRKDVDNPSELYKKLWIIEQSALVLDTRTRALSTLIYKRILRLKKEEESRIIKKPIIR